MRPRRILSLWFPRLAAERVLRAEGGALSGPFAVVAAEGNLWRLAALSAEAEAAGLFPGQPLRDALAMCPALVTRPARPPAEAAFLAALRRWAGRFSPWVAEEPPDGLIIDVTGCAHLFGGEAALMAEVEADCAALGLTVRAGLADTVGAAWAIARHGGGAGGRPAGAAAPGRSGDAIDQEARATRARAARRRAHPGRAAGGAVGGEGGAAAPGGPSGGAGMPARGRIAPPGGTRAAIAALPVAGLRLPPGTAAELQRLGLGRIGDLAALPRAALARRFGREVMRRLDQALGLEPEPVGPARPPLHFAVRLSFPDPIGRPEDILAALDRMLPVLAARLKEKGRGARRLRLEAWRADGGVQVLELGLARPADEAARLRPLLALKAEGIEAGFGLDRLRLEATVTEPLHPRSHRGHLEAAAAAAARLAAGGGGAAGAAAAEGVAGAGAEAAAAAALDDLIGRLGARIGLEAVTRLHPGDSHIPEKAGIVLGAAWSAPAADWPAPRAPRPLVLFRPEPVAAPDGPAPPAAFRWRRRAFRTRAATGPERIAPEWWLDEPDWRSGPRDYWRIETWEGERLWLFYAHGAALPGGWFAQGLFA